MMKFRMLRLLILAQLLCAVNVMNAQEYQGRSTIQKQFVEYYTSAELDDDDVQKLYDSLQSDGTWADIDYTSKRRGGWPTLAHLKNLVTMSEAYAHTQSKYYQQTEMKEAIINGINHWLTNDYINPNWWNPKIGIPENMLITFILLGDDLPKDVLKKAQQSVLKRTKIGMTGQNKVWLSGIAFMKGHLANDTELMQKAADTIWNELRVSSDEGIQPDWSFHQHGPQQQFGNYGLSYGSRMIMWGSILRSTPYAMPEDKLAIIRNYLIEGPAWVLWKGSMDLSACGRQINQGHPKQKYASIITQLKQMIDIDPAYRAKYEFLLSETDYLVGHKSYWRSEMAIQRANNWYASVKMSSTRVVGAETCNSENMQGAHLGDGVLMLYTSGDEYEDITPLWDWHRLPGTTCDQNMTELVPNSWNKNYGGSDFSGVIGDEQIGMAAMIYKRNALEAHKAWFFNKDVIVCLGAGINGETMGEVFTSVQQCYLKGKVVLNGEMLTGEEFVCTANSWIHHNGVGYQLFNEATCTMQNVDGNWQSCFPTMEDKAAKGDMFSLWINHSKSPQAQQYAYKIFPATQASEMKRKTKKDKTIILENSDKVQAVKNKSGIQAVFYEEGKYKLSNEIALEVSAPCLLMIGQETISVSDPLHKSDTIEVRYNSKEYVFDLSSDKERGKAVNLKL